MAKGKLPTTRVKTAYALLTRICEIALEEPKRIAMGIVCVRGASLPRYRSLRYKPACGTVGCVAGWVLVLAGLTGENEYNNDGTYDARKVLGLNFSEAEELFFPDKLIIASNMQTRAHAVAVVKHIQKFQAEHATQLKAKEIVYHR